MNPNLVPAAFTYPGLGRVIADYVPVALAQLSVAASAAMLLMARHRAGRVALHCFAMVGDRQVRFHCAGIAREMPWR